MSANPPAADAKPPEGRLARLAHRLADEDPSSKLSATARVIMTVGPFAGFGLLVLIAALCRGHRAAWFLAGAEVGSFIGAGKFVILAGVPRAAPLGVWPLANLVVYGDVATMLVMLANMHLLYRMPFVGHRLAQMHEASWYVLRANPWMRRMAWFGIILFIAVPFQGTGAVGGTILARLLGLSVLATVTAIPLGSALGCYPIALLGLYGRARGFEEIAEHPVAAILFFLVLIAVIVVLGRRFTGTTLRRKEEAAGGTPDDTR